jgi:hypothetical protein
MSTTSSIAFIPFTCPHCGAFTEVELAYAGKSGPCFVCGRTVKVPYVTTGTGLRTIQAEGVSPQAVATVTPARSQLINAGLILFGACLLLGAIGAIGFKLAAPAIIAIKKSSAMSESQSNMQQIVQALKAYEVQYGSLPPPYTVDANGKKMHSWRVLILPFLGENRVYGMYNMSEPWDSQNNIRLASEIPSVFHCTIDPSAKSLGETSYVVAIGPKTAFRDPTFNADEKTRENEKVKLNEITDGIESTILVVEYHQSGIGWTEPKDLNFGRMSFNINEDRSNTEIRSKHDGCAFVIRADGTPIKLEDGAAPGDVRAMLTIDGDEAIDWTQYDDDPNTTTSTPK